MYIIISKLYLTFRRRGNVPSCHPCLLIRRPIRFILLWAARWTWRDRGIPQAALCLCVYTYLRSRIPANRAHDSAYFCWLGAEDHVEHRNHRGEKHKAERRERLQRSVLHAVPVVRPTPQVQHVGQKPNAAAGLGRVLFVVSIFPERRSLLAAISFISACA